MVSDIEEKSSSIQRHACEAVEQLVSLPLAGDRHQRSWRPRLKAALFGGPVWVGPVEMGHLRHQPGRDGRIGADHYIVVLAVEDERVRMHDPQGYPFASLPLDDFMAAWRAETIDYGKPYTMRTHFRRVREVRMMR